jgi:hypothetical protein
MYIKTCLNIFRKKNPQQQQNQQIVDLLFCHFYFQHNNISKKLNMHIRNCHIQKTQPNDTANKKRKREKESMVNKMISFKTDNKQLTKLRTRGVNDLERSVAKQIANGV